MSRAGIHDACERGIDRRHMKFSLMSPASVTLSNGSLSRGRASTDIKGVNAVCGYAHRRQRFINRHRLNVAA
jgi:hypothetical protein